MTKTESNDSSFESFSSEINSPIHAAIQIPISRKTESNSNFEELQMPVNVPCENLTQEQCLVQPGCFLCLYECFTSGSGQYCPENIEYSPLPSDKVLNDLLLSNGTLEFYFDIQLDNPITAIGISLDVPYKDYINITADYDFVRKKVNCNLIPQDKSIVFPFYKTFHVFVDVYSGNIWPAHFVIADQVRLVDPVISEIGPNSALINHPSIFAFKFTRIVTKHIETVKVIWGNLTIGCNMESNVTVDFSCQIVVTSAVNWPEYLSIHVANINWYSHNFQLKPYPTINKTNLFHSFPGYLVPFHFIGTNFYSFQNLKVYISYFNGDKMLLNCTVVSDADLFCSNDKFPSYLPAIGTFIWYSHSNQLFNLPILKFKANPSPDVALFRHDKRENQLKIGISNYHPDYLTNTSITFVCDCEANLAFGCIQIQFQSVENLITCKFNNMSLTGTYDWVAILSIGNYEFYMPLKNRPKTPKIYFLVPLVIGLIVSIGFGAYCLKKHNSQEQKSEIQTSSEKSSSSIKDLPIKVPSTYRMNSYTKFPVMSRSDTNVTSKSLISPSQTFI